MRLPVMPPVRPMLAKATDALPEGSAGTWLFEPKWDGFRCIVFRDGDEVELGSRNERPLTRYFPELPAPLQASLPQRCVVDGEVVIAGDAKLDFDALQLRLHPAASRVNKLAGEIPASFVAFDLLAEGEDDLTELPFTDRRQRLEATLAGASNPVHLTPITSDRAVAADWFDRFEGAGLDGVVAKPADLPYRPNQRVMLKVKPQRTADCVVAGFRWHKSGDGVGSLLLGLYGVPLGGDQDGDRNTLHHMGVATSFTAKRRRELVDEIDPYRDDALDGHPWQSWAEADAGRAAEGRMPGAPSRWNAKKDLSWEPLRPELVAEVAYDHLQSGRFRHATRLVRWRFDRTPESCTYDQLAVTPPVELAHVFGA